ncbi:Uncharacterized protein HZ326_21884 [Fusarium oxysporum f. sp. albedinis]|nr:putative transcriptional regulatory protein C3C7.04 [Fusarium oxysporum f. sp. albedinis]KAJ0135075.1 Uncharacterized protein HZ326_21884 [Fusarium oxysporum f. sp. albedinis]
MKVTKTIELSLYGMLFLFEIATLVIVFVGFPAAPIAFIWVIQKMVTKTVDKGSLPHLTVVKRGDFYSLLLYYGGFHYLFYFTAYIVWDWSFNLYGLGYLNLSAYCRALVIFLPITWSLAWAAFLTLVGCALELGMPAIIQEMAFEMRMLLARCKVVSLPNKESKSNSLE